MKKPKQGKYTPKHPKKYVGDSNNIIYRSMLERNLMSWFDNNPNVLQWASEETRIKYINPLDNSSHTYFPDFLIEYLDTNQQKRKVLIEVKPYCQTIEPTPKKNKKTAIFEATNWIVNNAKWDAAKQWCKRNNVEFKILTEKEIRPNKNK